MTGALENIKILDLSRVLAGPYCTMILGDLGADVIKVEAPGGSDETRKWGPPFQNGVSAYYLCANRNKKSITLDLKSEEGIKAIKELVRGSDVVINNFKTGTMDRLGLDYETLADINPELVYCTITGFGETGPYKDMPGYDFIIQAMSGLMSITGDSASGPQKVGVAITDILTGLYACIGIQGALLERTYSGKGQKIDLSLYDSAVSALVNIGSNYLMAEKKPTALGNQHANIVPYQTFDTKDGQMVIAVGNDQQFQRLCTMLGKPEYGSDKRFTTNPDRVENRSVLIPLLQEVLSTESTAFWQEKLQKNSIPCGPIQSIDEVVKDPQLKARDMFINSEHPTAGSIRMIGSPLKLSRTPVNTRRHPPDAGEHTDSLLEQLGISKQKH
ncbi:Crotonobetainyl-CoA:carnitine CoA-transferase CaiB [Lentibacillus persicus]|uniref:Crotonobetainyl-CoA:carnitine CoA-transferase CaiB n=1 Tax=Lentibacillus persicus TaxID=640948 RepID=A0A1I1ZCV6_9BACI|nr:CoA transferase [Lentibacillus persicus]SFE29422.1 Crotonobetainyl-CoA:carnitine CoA-transferase CaiB [Lentibacillus persicus]